MSIVSTNIQLKMPSVPANREIRPVLITDSDQFAGTERHMIDLARALKNSGVDVSIACPSNSIIGEKAASILINVLKVPRENFLLSMSCLLAKELKRGRVNLLHAHNGVSHIVAVGAATLAGRGKCVVTQHFVNPARKYRRGLKAFLTQVIHEAARRKTARFIAVSKAVAHVCIEEKICAQEQLEVVLNGIFLPDETARFTSSEVRRQYSISESAPLVVCVSRLMPEKELDVLIKAMATVSARIKDAQCVIIGEGSSRGSLENLVAELKLENVVYLPGYRDQPNALVTVCDVFVSPGGGEGFGLTVIEAMSLCLPVVAANAGATAELIEHERTGLLFIPHNHESLANQIISLLTSEQMRNDLATNAERECAKKYTAELMAANTASVYKAVLSGGQED